MKIAFNQATTLASSTLEQDLILCEKHGYDFIEIRLDKLKEYLQTNTIDDLKDFFKNSKMKPLSLNAIEWFTFQNETTFALMKEDLRLLANVGQQIGCNTIVAVPSFEIGEKHWSEIKTETIRCLDELFQVVKDTPMRLALEFVGYPECSINTLNRAHEIINEMDNDRIGLVIDCFHLYAMNSNLDDLKKVDRDQIFLFHIDDCEDFVPGILRDQHRLFPGEGVIDLDKIISILNDKGFNGPASVELFRPAYWEMDPETCIRLSKEKTEGILKRIVSEGIS
ncbi:sugar phosphate isomerase/epimerase family protein [Pseudalkalibacillus sp. R45]|uniref:sugar phosphate isomerase/epimerase family protein n=1 Tax=Pseudalkalibacillus sp. R45 TaxID=3457433 RepID=UPI003FCD2C9B